MRRARRDPRRKRRFKGFARINLKEYNNSPPLCSSAILIINEILCRACIGFKGRRYDCQLQMIQDEGISFWELEDG